MECCFNLVHNIAKVWSDLMKRIEFKTTLFYRYASCFDGQPAIFLFVIFLSSNAVRMTKISVRNIFVRNLSIITEIVCRRDTLDD